jgi:activator of HSP90 ATPase
MSTHIHQEALYEATPKEIYQALTNPRQFAKLTGMGAKISTEVGGAFTLFDGHITGRHLELLPGKRIVQAWRTKQWNEGIYSIVKFEIKKQGAKTKLILDHIGFPKDQKKHLNAGWKQHYFEPLKNYLIGDQPVRRAA